MSNIEEAPLEIFEWLETSGIHDLPEKDRNIVLTYFTAEEYDEMRTAVNVLNKKAEADHVHSQYKSSAMATFDAAHKRTDKPHGVPLIWKIAAALLPFMLVAVTYWFTKGEDQARQTLVVHDTVYFDKTIQGSTIHDTVFIEKMGNSDGKSKIKKSIIKSPINGVTFQTTTEIEVVPFKEKEEIQNTIRNYSVREDSLFDLFPSVAM